MKPTNPERARACVAVGIPVYPLPALAAVDILALLDQVEADARRAALSDAIHVTLHHDCGSPTRDALVAKFRAMLDDAGKTA